MAKKKLGAVKLAKGKYKVTDPEDADRVLEVGGKKYEFKHGAVESLVVDAKEAEALVGAYAYLKAEKV